MAHTDLREFIAELEKQRELKRIAIEADPVLEIDGHGGETRLLRFDRDAGRHVPEPT